MLKKKLSKRTKRIALGATIAAIATFVSILKDSDKKVNIRDSIISDQDTYIYQLEQFIMENITGYDII